MTELARAVAAALNLPPAGVEATLRLLDDGATIPFISRYRKEATGGLDEIGVGLVEKEAERFRSLRKRKEYIIETISSQDRLTDSLRRSIDECTNATELEDIFAPYKPRKRTRATIARECGLEPLAAMIMAGNCRDTANAARRFVTSEVPDTSAAIDGASDIIAEWISDNAGVRKSLRKALRSSGILQSSPVKGKEEEGSTYGNYFGFRRRISDMPSHNFLALKRGEREGFLKVSLEVDSEKAIEDIRRRITRRDSSAECRRIIGDAASDSFKRMLKPSLDNEVQAEAKLRADTQAIGLFADNLRQLLLGAPLGHKRIMAIDPGFRTGCKLVCLGAQGELLHNDVIYPCAPRNDVAGASDKVRSLVDRFRIDAIAVGNGTAGRETEQFLRTLSFSRPVEIHIVDEAGASVYSASKVAREEFPDKDVTVRGAVSIGRRLLDPLAELVKIDPQSIGVGQYQHDVDQAMLKDALDATVMSCVNSVGVNVNTASPQLLAYVSGIGPALASKIVDFRNANGKFASREALKDVPRLGAKTFEQCAGFLRIPDSENPLDNTAVHPENYSLVARMARDLHTSVEKLVANDELLDSIDLKRYVNDSVGLPTLNDIISELKRPGRDPRTAPEILEFDRSINDISDLRPGMVIPGIITNLTAFGAFVDLGIKENGLLHISQISDKFISSPSQVLKLRQHVRVKVLEVDLDRRRISLTMKGIE